MRVLLLTGEHPDVPGLTGGIGSFVAEAAAALADGGHDVHVLVCAPGLPRSDRVAGGHTLHVRGLAPFLRPLRGRVLRQAGVAASCRWHARSLGRFDVVDAPEWQAIAAGFAVRRRYPLVISLQTPAAVVAAHDDASRPPARANDWLERWTVRRADAVLSLSRLLVDELRGTGWLDAATAVDLAIPVVRPEDWHATRRADDVSSPRILGIGRIEPRKGFDLLIDAVALLHDIPGLVVDIVGAATADHGYHLRSRAERLGVDLRLLGRQPRHDLPTVLAGARVVVLPSTFDSFNMAGLEALAAGVPVVVTDRVGLGERADGSEAITVVPRHAAALAEAIRPFVADALVDSSAGAAARAIAASCSPAAFAADRINHYERAMR